MATQQMLPNFSWKELAEMLCMSMERGTKEAKQKAKAQILRMAETLDDMCEREDQ